MYLSRSLLCSFLKAGVAVGFGAAITGAGSSCDSRSAGAEMRTEEGARGIAGRRTDGGTAEADLDAGVPSVWNRLLVRRLDLEDASGRGDSKGDTARELSVDRLEERAKERELDGSYPYHDRSRGGDGDVECPEVELVEYEGRIISYNRAVEVNPHFRERLVRFEKIVREVAIDVYGRPPARIVHRGGHDCKTVGRRGDELSEHAFGHAIDVVGFDFDAADESKSADAGGGPVAGEFDVRLAAHWSADEGFEARHRRFLRRLADALERRGPFSTMLGPSYPNHDEIFHFDFGPEFFFRL